MLSLCENWLPVGWAYAKLGPDLKNRNLRNNAYGPVGFWFRPKKVPKDLIPPMCTFKPKKMLSASTGGPRYREIQNINDILIWACILGIVSAISGFLLILLLTGREKIARTKGPEDIERKGHGQYDQKISANLCRMMVSLSLPAEGHCHLGITYWRLVTI